ncbi:histidine kinase [Hymenobacter sp. ASUV-10]|uniref:Histidine kinase n=1 Tax=Hymenobacter aranciens TaxID=3063996 RepID=A0ABT9BE17_9BACT|nr:tetratricopeptide repeat-containing sensor histidine kinase [Hymenobacter sp. ASUV-10]MDO7876513.1 histidine kinase [Hymenobacter sp. ASUV-10]
MRLCWRFLAITLVTCLLQGAAGAATLPALDSLKTLARRPGLADTVRVRLYASITRQLAKTDLDSARYYGERALRLARRIGFRLGEAQACNNLAAALYYSNDYEGAQQLFEQTLRAARQARSQLLIGHAYLGLGSVARALGNEEGAFAYNQQARVAYAACQPPNVRGLALVLHNIANHYLDEEKTSQAAPLVRQALALVQPTTDVSMKARLLNQLGLVQADQHQPDSAKASWRESIRLARSIQSVAVEALALSRLAEISLQQRQPAAARSYAEQALRLNRELGDYVSVADDLHVLALALHQQGQPGAFDSLNRYVALRDTIFDQERTEAVAEAQARFDRAEQQARIRSLEQQRRITELVAGQRRNRNQLIIATLSVGLALLVIGGVRLYRRRQKSQEAALRQRIAADLHDDVGSLLTQISLQSELLSQGVYGPDQQAQYLTHMAEASRTAVRQMSDVVWGLQADIGNNELAGLLDRLREHAHEVLSASSIEVDFATEPGLEALTLPLETRQALYLIYKEALHNTVKHAHGATLVTIRLARLKNQLQLQVRDNGDGTTTDALSSGGNGLRNMQARARAVGGLVKYEAAGPGFWVTVLLPMS